MSFTAPLLILFILVGIGLLLRRRLPTAPPRVTDADLEARLLRMALGDRAQVERLIANEQRRAPGGNRHTWMKEAIRRWERDLR